MKCSNCQKDVGDIRARSAFICVEVAGDEYIYSYLLCDACGFYNLETYRDRFMGEEDVRISAPIELEEGAALVEFIRKCKKPNNKKCKCIAHRQIGS